MTHQSQFRGNHLMKLDSKIIFQKSAFLPIIVMIYFSQLLRHAMCIPIVQKNVHSQEVEN